MKLRLSFIGNGMTNNDSDRLVIRCKTIAEIMRHEMKKQLRFEDKH